jgi:hypothetical protein
MLVTGTPQTRAVLPGASRGCHPFDGSLPRLEWDTTVRRATNGNENWNTWGRHYDKVKEDMRITYGLELRFSHNDNTEVCGQA